MNIEYFPDGSVDCPLILIYGANHQEAILLHQTLGQLAGGVEIPIAIHNLPDFVSVDGCEIHAAIAKWDIGVIQVGKTNTFKWSLRPIAWDNVIGLVEPFCQPREASQTTCQYLDDASGISVILSTSRTW